MPRESKPLDARVRRAAAIVGVLAILGIGGWVVTLPMRQTRFQVVEHRLERSGREIEVRGRLKNRGPEARQVLVEAYLYDEENRWLGTAQTTIERAPGDSVIPFSVPIDAATAGSIERYSLYAGLEPNPFAPGM